MERKRHEDIQNIITRWLHETIGYDNELHIVTAFEVFGKNIYLYSNYPGILIGKYGSSLEKLRQQMPKGIKQIYCVELGNSCYPREITVKRKFW